MNLMSPNTDWLRVQEEVDGAKIMWPPSTNHKTGGLVGDSPVVELWSVVDPWVDVFVGLPVTRFAPDHEEVRHQGRTVRHVLYRLPVHNGEIIRS